MSAPDSLISALERGMSLQHDDDERASRACLSLIIQALSAACATVAQPQGEQMLALRDRLEGFHGVVPDAPYRDGRG